MPPAGHDGHGRPHVPPVPLRETHAPEPGPRPVRQPRDEPLHRLLPLRAVLSRLRRRPRPGSPRRAPLRLLRPRARRRPRKRVQRQPRRGLPDRCLHRQDAQGALHAKVGHADRALDLRPLRPRLQYDSGGALRPAALRPQSLQRPGQRLFPVRPRAIRLRVRELAQPHPPADAARRCRRERGDHARERAAVPRRDPSPRPAARHRHRIAARVARGEFRPADAGRAGALFRGLVRK